MADFTSWTVKEASEAIDAAILEQLGTREAFDSNAAYAEDHDHWQDGVTWVGPDGGSEAVWKEVVKARVARSFTPVGAIEEALGRMANALLQKEADIDLVPLEPAEEGSDAEAAQMARAEELKGHLSAWWDRVKLWKLARRAVIRSCWAVRGSLRTWIAPGNLEEAEQDGEDGPVTVTRLPTGLDLAEAFGKVELSAPRPDVALVHTDEETRRKVAIFMYDDDGNQRAELWWVDDAGRTVLRVAGDREEGGQDFLLDLQGRLPIAEMESELLITEPVRRQQAQLDFENSLITRVSESAGFPERYTLNAEPAGVWLKTPAADPNAKTTQHNGATWYLHTVPRALGPMVTTDLVGLVTDTGDGEKRATPGVVFKEPTDPEYAIKAKHASYFQLLKEVHQGHLATESTAEASGEAYQQSRADYEDDLNIVKGDLEGMVREILEATLAWVGAMSAEGSRILEEYRIVVTLNVRSGPITPEEQRQNNANVEAGTLSLESAMAANGVEDVDAELKKLHSQPDFIASLRKNQTLAILELVREGIGYELAGRWIGVADEEDLQVLREMDASRQEPQSQQQAQDDEIAAILTGTAAGAA